MHVEIKGDLEEGIARLQCMQDIVSCNEGMLIRPECTNRALLEVA